MSAVLDHHGGHGHADDHGHDDHHGAPHGWRRWVFATNHKDIGTLYLLFAFTMLMIGGVLALLIRLELFQPGLQFVNPELFNQFTTMHGLIMVFGAIMPAFVGFANWQIPMMIGAPDMAFARMNNWSFWLLPPAAIMLVGSFFAIVATEATSGLGQQLGIPSTWFGIVGGLVVMACVYGIIQMNESNAVDTGNGAIEQLVPAPALQSFLPASEMP